MLLLNLDKGSSVIPLYRQVYNQVSALIESGNLKPGSRLPSSRTLADSNGISRITVTKAYEELLWHGYIESRPGGYTTIRSKRRETIFTGKESGCGIDWDVVTTPGCCKDQQCIEDALLRPLKRGAEDDFIDFAWFDIDKRIFPYKEFRRSLITALDKYGNDLFVYAEFPGFRPLREFIASRMSYHGVLVDPREILITNGSQQGLELIVQVLCRPGSKVIVESPSYLNFLELLRNNDVEIIEINVEDGGVNLRELERLIARHRPSFYYTMPNFQNPTGISMIQSRREGVLNICKKYSVPLVEDGFDEEMKYMGKLPLSIKAIDKHNIVIYVSSFSKVLSTGLRVGWVVTHDSLIRRLLYFKRFSDISVNLLTQAALYEFCKAGYFESHMRRINRVFRKRMSLALQTMKDNIRNQNISWTMPAGGYLIWVRLENIMISEPELMAAIESFKINVNPGSRFYSYKPDFLCFRLTISKLNEIEIQTGLKRLALALNKVYSERGIPQA